MKLIHITIIYLINTFSLMAQTQINGEIVTSYEEAISKKEQVIHLEINMDELQKFNRQIGFLTNLEKLTIVGGGIWVITTAEIYFEPVNFDVSLLDRFFPNDLYKCKKLKYLDIGRLINSIPEQITKLEYLEYLHIQFINIFDMKNNKIFEIDLDIEINKIKQLKNLKKLSIKDSYIPQSTKLLFAEYFKEIIEY